MAGVRVNRIARLIEGVQISLKVSLSGHFERYEITPIWKAVDRPNVGGYALSTMDEALALRVVHCMVNGAFFADVERAIDNNGQSYMKSTPAVFMTTLDEDLRRLGY